MKLENFKEKLIESLFGNVLMMALNLILPMVITRLYDVEIYGSYVYGITIVSIALFLANLGMETGLLYFIPKEGNRYVSSAFLINILTSVLAIIMVLVFFPKQLVPYLGLIWLLSAEQLFFSLYRSQHKIKNFFLIKSFVGLGLTMVIAGVFTLWFEPSETHLIIATYISVILSNILYMFENKGMFGPLHMKMEFISYSVTIILGGVMSLVISYIDIVMIEAMMTKSDVGIYKVGTELSQLPSMFLRIVNTVFPPLISKLYHEGKVEEVRRLYEKITRYLFVVSSVVIFFILIFAEPILKLYGEVYLLGKQVLIYRSIGQLVNASVGSVWYIVIMTGHPKIRFVGVLISAVMNVILNALFIPIWGIDGAAFASMISTVFINILGFFIVKKILNSKVYYII
ncbi:MAG: flippase [Clostridia bacterium]|nr:flippase [Clostridia bacterium]